MNYLNISGRLTKKAELKVAKNSDTKYTFFNVAVNTYNKDTVFLPATAFEKTAEFLCNNFEKGQPIIVIGHLSTNSSDNKTTFNSLQIRLNLRDIVKTKSKATPIIQ